MIEPVDGGAVVRVRVIPRSTRSRLDGTRDGALLVRLAAPPVDGAANAALIELLARALDVSRRSLAVVGGERSRLKRVRVDGLDAGQVARRLAATK